MHGSRPHRVGMLSRSLELKGHSVVWWTTTFDHQKKKYIFDSYSEVSHGGIRMSFLHPTTPYYKNVSIRRLVNHWQVGKCFKKKSNSCERPDLIFCAFPTIDLSYEAVKYGRKNKIPVVIDVRDLWPDIFLDPFPKSLKFFLKMFLINYHHKTQYIFRNCTAITSVSDGYLDFGLKCGNRVKTDLDKVFPLSYLKSNSGTEVDQNFLDKGLLELNRHKERKIIWFSGTFGRTYDLIPVIKAAKEIQHRKDILFVFSGDGEQAKKWKRKSGKAKNIIFTGWVDRVELSFLLKIATIGLMSYSKNSPQGLPNKIFEYLSSGTPILSSLEGESRDFIQENSIGFSYDSSDHKDFLNKLLSLVDDGELLETMSKRCKFLYKTKYSSEVVYNNLSNHLERVEKYDE